MIPLKTRSDLITLVAQAARTPPAAKRACLTGTVEVLGGFSEIPPSTAPGWVVTVTTIRKMVYHIAVVPDDLGHRYRIWQLTQIPWHLWVGQPLQGTDYSIYRGDHPAAYDARRDCALERFARCRRTAPV